MPTKVHATTPYWSTSATFTQFPKLAEDVVADVVVVGAGVTGLTAAYLLAKAGKRVVVLERDRCAGVDTGHTSAHLTMVTDVRLGELVKRFGRNHTQAVWDAGLAAIATIDEVVREHAIDASFDWVDGYQHVPPDDTDHNSEDLKADATLAADLGFDAEYVETVPLVDRPGIRFTNQARIQPRAYLAGVAKAFITLGGRIYEHSSADDFCDDPRAVKAAGHTVRGEDIVIATHNPLVGLAGFAGATLFQTKLALYTSYVIAGRAPKGEVPDALWWDTEEPYHYLRVEPHRDFDVVIFGDEDHKTGQVDDTEGCYRRLEERLQTIVPRVELTHRWSGQVIETPDGLPYIGRAAAHQYAATGYAGNGLTFGTLAAMMISDAILEPVKPVDGSVRSKSEGADARSLGLPQGERRLPVLHDSRPLCRGRGEVASSRAAGRRQTHRAERGESGGVPRPQWRGDAPLGHLHGTQDIGPHRRYPRQWFALGYGGNGMTFGFLAARLLLERWQGQVTRDHAFFEFGRIGRR